MDGGGHAEGDITLRAQDTSTILAAGAASAVSASFGPSSVAIAVGVSLGSNQISNTIAAFVDGSTVTTATGGLTLQAIEAATIAATSQMAAVSLSTGVAIAGGGADSNGVVTTATKADVKNSMVTLGGGMTINVQDTFIASAIVETTAVAAGIGFAAAGSTATTTLRPTVAATVSNSTVTAVGDIEIGSDSKIWGSVLAKGNSFGLFAAAGSFATSTLDPTVVATITGGSVTSTGGGILLASRYNTVTDSNGDFLNATTALLPVGLRPASPLPLGGLAEVRASSGGIVAASADSTSASAVGASGANAYATSDTAARTIVSPSVQVRSTGTIAVTSANTFYRIGNGIATVSAAGGGGATATAAGSTTTLGGLSRVTIGDDVKFTVAAAPLSRDGIYVVASTNAKVSDSLDLQAGGALTGAGVDADLTVTATNEVVVGNRGAFTSTGNIGIGTYTDATASTQALASTWGLAAVGVAYAKSHVISTQSVTIGTDNDILAFGNVDLVTGSDPTSAFQTILQPIAVAQGFISGVIAIPDATADAIVTSNAALTVGVRTRVRSGQNSTLAARRGTLLPTADGTAKGYQLGLIPVTVTDSNPAVLAGVGTVTVNGTVEAGIYNTLDIRIPDSRNAGIFSSTSWSRPVACRSAASGFRNLSRPTSHHATTTARSSNRSMRPRHQRRSGPGGSGRCLRPEAMRSSMPTSWAGPAA